MGSEQKIPWLRTTNVQNIGAAGGRLSQTPVSQKAQTSGAQVVSPLFGRPQWTYVQVQQGPVRGPQPRLAHGSGRTGASSLPGNTPQLPGYLSDNEYFPSTFTYDPVNFPGFMRPIARSINTGDDGRQLVGTYVPHDKTPGQRFLGVLRQAANWQVMEYPPDNRQLLAWKQLERYRIQSHTLSPRPLDSSQYFLGYQINPQIAAQIGQSTLGYMGSF